MEYIATYHTDVGTRKETNQDSLAIKVVNTKEGNVAFAIVCDGMGGLAKGEVASKEVIEAFCTWFDDTLVDEIQNGTFTEQNLVSQWDDIIQIQNRRLGAYGEENHLQLGTTVSAILLYKDQYYIVHVGDSRVYELTKTAKQLTNDQTFIARELAAGRMTPEQAKEYKDQKKLKHALKEQAVKLYEEKEAEFPEPEAVRELERVILLKVIDRKWMDHIDDMDQLRQGIGLQAYGQRDPLVEYNMSGYDMFEEMIRSIEEDTVRTILHVKLEQKVEREQVAKVTGTNKDETAQGVPKKRAAAKVYPNDPCPCGSGKKYKQCCGRKNKA